MKKCLFLFLWSAVLSAQIEEPVTWETSMEVQENNVYLLVFKATIAPKWHLYSQTSNPDGAIPTEFLFEEHPFYKKIGKLEESPSIVAFDSVFEMDLTFFNNEATFKQKIEIPNRDAIKELNVEVNYQACDDELCIFRTENFRFFKNKAEKNGIQQLDPESQKRSDALKLELTDTAYIENPPKEEGTYSFLNIFLLGFVGGLLALLTPCVFPMIPLTVSYFLKQASAPSKGILNALLYAFFIVGIYGFLSLPFHFIDSLNPEILNTLATNVFLNVFFFAVFVFFAFSFFGFYELTLPSRWGDKTDAASTGSGMLGIFFMALTLAIVSFSCTGPILGSLLAGSLTADGGATQLSVGMLGFGIALGLPFGLFALFPNTLKALPKSGSWMTTIKVILGFLELALALKFLSNADLVAHWGLLKRETFLAIWILLSLALCLYLFGLYRFKNEVKVPVHKVRIGLGIGMLFFSGFLINGLFSKENTLKLLSGFPPPDFYSLRAQDSDCPLGLECYKDFETGLAAAQLAKKPILLDFTGWACINCRKMEENVWSSPEVYPLLRDDFIIISLYVDDRKPLSKADEFDFQYPNGRIKNINTIGKKWATFQAVNFNTASQPFYIQMTSDGRLLNHSIQYTDVPNFHKWLLQGLENLKAQPKATYFKF